jgi:hypothetical protein
MALKPSSKELTPEEKKKRSDEYSRNQNFIDQQRRAEKAAGLSFWEQQKRAAAERAKTGPTLASFSPVKEEQPKGDKTAKIRNAQAVKRSEEAEMRQRDRNAKKVEIYYPEPPDAKEGPTGLSMKRIKFRAIIAPEIDPIAAFAPTRDALSKLGEAVKDYLLGYTTTWTDKPSFNKVVTHSAGEAGVTVYLRSSSTAGGKKFSWLDQGTKARVISAKNKKALKLNPKFAPKSGSVVKSYFLGSKNVLFANAPNYRGIYARQFMEMTFEDWEKDFLKIVDASFGT